MLALAGLLREYCDHLSVIVGTRVQGAGSLLALGADEVVIGPLSELGGVEAIRNHPLLPRAEGGQPVPMYFADAESFALPERAFRGSSRANQSAQTPTPDPWKETAGSVPSQMLSRLFDYIHPLSIANLQQADTLSREVTRKALPCTCTRTIRWKWTSW